MSGIGGVTCHDCAGGIYGGYTRLMDDKKGLFAVVLMILHVFSLLMCYFVADIRA
jgi:hypothetical protein